LKVVVLIIAPVLVLPVASTENNVPLSAGFLTSMFNAVCPVTGLITKPRLPTAPVAITCSPMVKMLELPSAALAPKAVTKSVTCDCAITNCD
jgi:hypothetical protein